VIGSDAGSQAKFWAITGVIHITERITTLGGRTTTAAIEVTGITSIIATAIKAGRVGVRAKELEAIPSQPFVASGSSVALIQVDRLRSSKQSGINDAGYKI
jgi:hypothetical protein